MSSETNNPTLSPLDQASQISAEMHDRLAAQHANGEPLEALFNDMDRFSGAVFATTGVSTADAPNPYPFKELINGYEVPALSRLNLAVGVAEEATSLGFTLEGDDEAAIEQAQRLIDDYDAFIEPRMTGKSELPDDYGKRQAVKLLLVESSARDLARRLGIEDPVLDRHTIAAIKERTGVGFHELRHGYPGPIREVKYVEPRINKESDHYSGPPGLPVVVSGIGSTVIMGYNQHGKPVVRGKNGKLMSTFGRL